jgi:amidase
MMNLKQMVAWNIANNATTGASGNNTGWFDPMLGGQSFYGAGIASNGTLDTAFWTAFGWGRLTARQAIGSAHFYTRPHGTVVELDGVLHNGRDGTGANACAAAPSYAGYPIASVIVGLDGFSTSFGICVYGQQSGGARLVRIASAMEDLFRWSEESR